MRWLRCGAARDGLTLALASPRASSTDSNSAAAGGVNAAATAAEIVYKLRLLACAACGSWCTVPVLSCMVKWLALRLRKAAVVQRAGTSINVLVHSYSKKNVWVDQRRLPFFLFFRVLSFVALLSVAKCLASRL